METRKITIISNKGQYKKVMESAATTLGELKADMSAVGIDYNGMSFLEGLTRTELVDNASQLPTNVMYRGQTTNDLVFYLTATNKKIKSGAMTRQEVYSILAESPILKEIVKDEYGRNYTQVSTEDLVRIIVENDKKAILETPAEAKCPTNQVEVLAELLLVNGCISEEQYETVMEMSEGADSPYSDEEIEDMFDFVN